MKILFDFNHPVDVNFFKNTIYKLSDEGHDINIIFRYRGKLEQILRYELGEYPISVFGRHRKSFIGKIFYQLIRDFQVYFYIKNKKIDLIACFGATSAIAAKVAGIPCLAFDDDFEYKIPFYHANWFATKHIFPDYIKFSNKRTFKFHGFKELAYIHPKYLELNEKSLLEFGLSANEYIFIREISNVSLNYKLNTTYIDEIIPYLKNKGYDILLSLENKLLMKKFSSDCIILEEPVIDLYSLIYYSTFTISSGDTVARESSLLGVPTIYTGGRDMAVNDLLISCEIMYKLSDVNLIKKQIDSFSLENEHRLRETINELVMNELDDTTEVILKHIKEYC